ncbi:hypothetical protein [Ponticoccus alexandrii]|uniref:Uncharacterized protein n=1 Tax=Ponticoccus alexandrii TaxID=1943633 RepID=A0ABX7FA92_9RHOB|nr:hypothetical protein [Ponticoccus alexandrii]QRF66781.1 hypothetical protein GQA70_10955 [Ponticoccus alexandrii]
MINNLGLPGFMLLFGVTPANVIAWAGPKTMMLPYPYPDPQLLLPISMIMG